MTWPHLISHHFTSKHPEVCTHVTKYGVGNLPPSHYYHIYENYLCQMGCHYPCKLLNYPQWVNLNPCSITKETAELYVVYYMLENRVERNMAFFPSTTTSSNVPLYSYKKCIYKQISLHDMTWISLTQNYDTPGLSHTQYLALNLI